MGNQKGVGSGSQIPVILKVAKLSTTMALTTAATAFDDITFDKEIDEVVLIYAVDMIPFNLNGLGTGSEVSAILTRDNDQETIDFDDDDTLFAWEGVKSFVTSGMQIEFYNLMKTLQHPVITSQPTLRVVGRIETATWTSGGIQMYVYYSTRALDAEARRVLIGGR